MNLPEHRSMPTVTNEAIEFANFPVRDLIVKILGTEDGVDEIIAAIGQIDYNVPYTAQISEDKASVAMTLKPEVLKLTLPGSGEEDPGTEIEVTIEATDGTYTLESKALEFGLAVAGVKVAGVDLPGFRIVLAGFRPCKKIDPVGITDYNKASGTLRRLCYIVFTFLRVVVFRWSSPIHSTELQPQYGRLVRSLPSIRVAVTYARPVTRSMVIHERLC